MRPVLAFVVVVCACGGNAPQKPAPKLNRWGKPLVARPAPDWVEKLPQSSRTRIVAVGRSGPTFWPQDALNNAREDARGKIALQLTAHVERYGAATDASGRAARGLSVDEVSHSEDPERSFRDLVQKGARIEQVWVDEDGSRPGDPPGSAWALAVIDVPSSAGGYQPLENPDIGPALDRQGNVPSEPTGTQP